MREWNDDSISDVQSPGGSHATPAEPNETAAIRAGISHTRERLSDTLSELGERLNPHVVREQVSERVKEGIREATIGRVEHMARNAANTVNATRTSITETIRDNPVPAAMVAIGLGWLLFNGRRDSADSAGIRAYDENASIGRASQFVDNVRDRVSDVAGSVADSVKEGASQLADRGRQLADRAGTAASSAASSVSTRTHDVADSVATRTKQGARRVENSFYQNPLAIGAMTAALGVMAGLAAPATDREVRLMGDAREKVADRVKDVAHDTKEKVQHVAAQVIDETKRAVKAEGFGTSAHASSLSSPSLTNVDVAQNPS